MSEPDMTPTISLAATARVAKQSDSPGMSGEARSSQQETHTEGMEGCRTLHESPSRRQFEARRACSKVSLKPGKVLRAAAKSTAAAEDAEASGGAVAKYLIPYYI